MGERRECGKPLTSLVSGGGRMRGRVKEGDECQRLNSLNSLTKISPELDKIIFSQLIPV